MKLAERDVPVFQGRLMAPSEVRGAVYGRGGSLPQAYMQSWYLCGDVSEEFYRRVANDENIAFNLNLFTTPGKTFFAVFVLQIRECQARFLLPLASERSVRFLEQAERTGVFMSLGKAGGNAALLVEFLCVQGKLAEFRADVRNSKSLPRDIDIIELRLASFSMMQVDMISSAFEGTSVSDVCLSVVLDD